MSQNNTKPQSLEQFIESQKTQYGTQKGILATQEYVAIIQPYVSQIIRLQQENKALLERLPKKERVKIKQKGKK
ncbi:hypothetical protein K0U27_00785 [archaeon]|nr:hypothetical protein [archaeon]